MNRRLPQSARKLHTTLRRARRTAGRVTRASLHQGWLWGMRSGLRQFERALSAPDAVQIALLRAHIARHHNTVYGQQHNIAELLTLPDAKLHAAWQDRVPMRDYAGLAPWIEQAAGGQANVLSAEPPHLYEQSSGSTSARKLLPYTHGLLQQFDAATAPWLVSLHQRWPGLLGRQAYWSISPVVRTRATTASGVPIGVEDDSAYLTLLGRLAMTRLVAVNQSVSRAETMAQWQRQTLDQLLRAEDLGLISVWSPSFLTALMTALEQDWDSYMTALPRLLRRDIDGRVQRQGLTGQALWPGLRVLSCWTDAAAATQLRTLRRWFPQAPIQAKGLLATEGVVSLPWLPQAKAHRHPCGDAPQVITDDWGGPMVPSVRLAAITSHVLEFVPADKPESPALLAGQLRRGARYIPLITTAGGLWRYRLGDVVRCTGHVERTPELIFEGRADAVSDLVGEKLHPTFVAQCLAEACADSGLPTDFAMLVPTQPAGYVAHVQWSNLSLPPTSAGAATDSNTQTQRRSWLLALDAALRNNPHYAYARDLGQLQPLDICEHDDGTAWYHTRQLARGQRLGDIKPTALDVRLT